MDEREGDDSEAQERVLAGMGALWIPVFVASFSIAAVILLSLWVSGWRTDQALIAQVEPTWRPGETLALRVLHIDGARQPRLGSRAAITVAQGSTVHRLTDLEDRGDAGVLQGRFIVPELTEGPAALGIEIHSDDGDGGERGERVDPLRTWVAVAIAEERPPRSGALTISTSNLNWGDNTEPQPAGLQIVLRPERRLLAGFDNTLMLRIADGDGHPQVATVEVALLGGEFMGARGSTREPPILHSGETDALGLVMLHGPVTSEILELEVRVIEPAAVFTEDGRIRGRRRFRMVSFAGAVRLEGEPLALRPGEPLAIAARGLRRARPIYVDLHGEDGAWIDTLPPVVGPQPPQAWSTVGRARGFIQAEGYYFTNDPGESAEILRIQVTEAPPEEATSLGPLIARYRELLELPRVERAFDRQAEGAFLAALERQHLRPAEVAQARRFLLGTLPIQVLGPPLAVDTLGPTQEALIAKKQAWYRGLRLSLLGGGGLFLLLLAAMILWRHTRTAEATAEVLGGIEEDPELAATIAGARRGVLVRMWAVVVVMGLGLLLTAAALERIVWRV